MLGGGGGGVQVNVGGVQNMLGGCTNEVGGVRTPHPPPPPPPPPPENPPVLYVCRMALFLTSLFWFSTTFR